MLKLNIMNKDKYNALSTICQMLSNRHIIPYDYYYDDSLNICFCLGAFNDFQINELKKFTQYKLSDVLKSKHKYETKDFIEKDLVKFDNDSQRICFHTNFTSLLFHLICYNFQDSIECFKNNLQEISKNVNPNQREVLSNDDGIIILNLSYYNKIRDEKFINISDYSLIEHLFAEIGQIMGKNLKQDIYINLKEIDLILKNLDERYDFSKIEKNI